MKCNNKSRASLLGVVLQNINIVVAQQNNITVYAFTTKQSRKKMKVHWLNFCIEFVAIRNDET